MFWPVYFLLTLPVVEKSLMRSSRSCKDKISFYSLFLKSLFAT